jgi:hypothetical protein
MQDRRIGAPTLPDQGRRSLALAGDVNRSQKGGP